jgi:hypothetical protein
MRRPVEEVVASQWKMLERQGRNPKSERDHLIAAQTTHQEQVLNTLRTSQRVDLLEIDFHQLINNPPVVIARVAGFLGPAFQCELGGLAAVVKPELHRNRTGTAVS